MLYLGRIKVSHSKVPDAFIDDALKAFKQKERMRERRGSDSIEVRKNRGEFLKNKSTVSPQCVLS